MSEDSVHDAVQQPVDGAIDEQQQHGGSRYLWVQSVLYDNGVDKDDDEGRVADDEADDDDEQGAYQGSVRYCLSAHGGAAPPVVRVASSGAPSFDAGVERPLRAV